MENGRNRQYLNMPALQEPPVTLGELLYRDGLLDGPEPTPQRQMGRTMSQARCLGPLANGRPRRARGRTLTRSATSAGNEDEDTSAALQEPRPPQPRRRLPSSGSSDDFSRWRNAEARIRNFFCVMNGQRRRGTTSATRSGHNSLARWNDSTDLLGSLSWHRRNSAGGRLTRTRTSTNTSNRSTLPRRSQRLRTSMSRSSAGSSRNNEDTRPPRPSYHSFRANRARTARASTDATTDAANTNSNSEPEIPATVRRFINFAAEFFPVEPHSPDAEPPEWSLNITAADFGPFAIGRSALSRARSLAVMGVLSQVDDDTGADGTAPGSTADDGTARAPGTNEQPRANEN